MNKIHVLIALHAVVYKDFWDIDKLVSWVERIIENSSNPPLWIEDVASSNDLIVAEKTLYKASLEKDILLSILPYKLTSGITIIKYFDGLISAEDLKMELLIEIDSGDSWDKDFGDFSSLLTQLTNTNANKYKSELEFYSKFARTCIERLDNISSITQSSDEWIFLT